MLFGCFVLKVPSNVLKLYLELQAVLPLCFLLFFSGAYLYLQGQLYICPCVWFCALLQYNEAQCQTPSILHISKIYHMVSVIHNHGGW